MIIRTEADIETMDFIGGVYRVKTVNLARRHIRWMTIEHTEVQT